MVDGAEIEDNIRQSGNLIRWWHIVMTLGFILVLFIIAPRGKSPEFAHLTIGTISQAKIIAPFDFEILKNNEELKTEREAVSQLIPPVFSRSDSVALIAVRSLTGFGTDVAKLFESLPTEWLKNVNDSSDAWNESGGGLFVKGSRVISEKYGLHLNWEQWEFLLRLYLHKADHGNYNDFFNRIGSEALRKIYHIGVGRLILDDVPAETRFITILGGNEETTIPVDSLYWSGRNSIRLLNEMNRTFLVSVPDSNGFIVASAIISQFIFPDLNYDAQETERRRELAFNGVPLAKGFVKQDELIIDRHIKVTEEHLAKLHSLAVKRAEMSKEPGGIKAILPALGQIILLVLLALFLIIGVGFAKPEFWINWRKLLLLLLIIVVTLLFFRTVPIEFGLSRQLFPAAFAALLLTILLGKSIAALGVVVLALLGGFLQGNDFQTTTGALANGGVAILALRSLKARRDVVRTGLYLAITSSVVVTGFYLMTYAGDTSFPEEMGIALGMAFLSPILVLGIVPLIESFFGITTDLTLLELVDLNRPLLRQLALKSPGTYHHSLMVGSLAEAGARAIGANSLLTRAGAYYHDIGKMNYREYFIENQETGSENIHERLPPSESARIVIDHVTKGLELAEQHDLPPEIKMFITEHHGKTKLAYFHSKAQREQGIKIDDNRFRYSGPKPQSRETAILMLADGIEASTRSLDHPSYQDLREMVDKFVAVRLAEGDLDECPLTLMEITRIKAAFLGILQGIHHQRIQYPDSSPEIENLSSNKSD